VYSRVALAEMSRSQKDFWSNTTLTVQTMGEGGKHGKYQQIVEGLKSKIIQTEKYKKNTLENT